MGIVGWTSSLCRYGDRIPLWLCAPALKLEYDVQSVDDALEVHVSNCCTGRSGSGTHRNVAKDGQQDVDEEISIAAALEEDTQRREDNGKDDLADVAGGERHGGGGLACLGL